MLFLIFSVSANADWNTYENDLRNSASPDGIGYFPVNTANFTNNDFGTDFQPLVSDLDNDGNNEIIIFSNNSLIILNPQLDIKSQTKIGSILGQPTLFNLNGTANIIFNARQNSDYFFAYKFYNSTLVQIFNISLTNDADFGGIKCLNLNETDICVFKDRKNYVNIINMGSRVDTKYNASAYDETRQTVPAIGDIYNDGRHEAVWWFNEDNSSGYGFLVFDLNNRRLDTNFNNRGIIDNIFSPLILGPSLYHQLFTLKGQPVLVDLNRDGRLEITASVFYNDQSNNEAIFDDWFTELIVYSNNGTKLFSKCEAGAYGCNDGESGTGGKHVWEGTNPFVMDYDRTGAEDICFIKDFKKNIGHVVFSNMGMNCYNYSGDEIAKVSLSSSPDAVKETAMAADMNDDGSKEIITSTRVYLLNGTSIFDYNLGKYHPIAVDLDGNNGLDLLWSINGQTKTFLDDNNYTMDLSVSSSDINFFKFNSTHVNVTAVIKNSGQMQADNVKVIMYNTETLDNNAAVFNIRKNGNVTFSPILPLKEKEKVLVSADYDNEINESDENNNDEFRTFLGLPYVFVSVDLEPNNIEPEFKDYIKNNLVSGYYAENENEADVLVYIGKNNPRNRVNNINVMDQHNMMYDYGNINYNDKVYSNPFNGLVASFKEDKQFGKNHVNIMVVGNEIEGSVAATKEFIKNQVRFLNTQTFDSAAVDDGNEGAVKVWDYMHLGGNSEHYKDGSDEFKKIVRNALNDKMFNVYDKTVLTSNGVNLRLRNLKANFSDDFIDYLNSSGTPTDIPIVLARGVHSNLTSWEVLGSEFANEGRDAWLIEITGGPDEECDTCPNYNFSDLTDYYWPALINGVLNFTGRDKIQYVGHSNGGRVAIVSLADGKVNPDKIDTLIGVAVPGAFEGYSTFGYYFGKYGEQIMNQLNGSSHVSMTEIGDNLREICLSDAELFCSIFTRGLKSESKMSFNSDKQYYLWINDTKDEQIGKNLQLNNFYLIEGWVRDNTNKSITHDFIVTEQDEKALYGNIISSNKKHYKLFGAHTAGWSSVSLPDRDFTKSIIKDALNKKPLNKYKSNEINST